MFFIFTEKYRKMAKRKTVVALVYDFDGTLAPGNMQEWGFIQAIGTNPEEFWK